MSGSQVAIYLTTTEVARILHVSPKTVTRWAKMGRLPHSLTLGGHHRYPADAIWELAESREVSQGPLSGASAP